MKLYIKQKVFSWGDKFNIYDVNGETRYYCQGEVFTLGKKLHLFDNDGTEKAYIHQKIFSFLPKFYIARDGEDIAEVAKRFSFKPKYDINGLGWFVSGNFWEHDYVIESDDGPIAHISKQWFAWGDTYEIDMEDTEDCVNVLSVVLVIDAALAQTSAASSS